MIKDRVYGEKFTNIDELKAAIAREISVIDADKDLLRKVCASVTNRIKECIDANGEHFEYKR